VRENIHLAYAQHRARCPGRDQRSRPPALTDLTDAAALYVGMTRGRRSNTVHIVARTHDQAREQWVAASGRDRADLGVDQGRAAATVEAATYTAAAQGGVQAPRMDGRRDPARFSARLSRLNSKLQQRPAPTPNSDADTTDGDPDIHRDRVVQRQPRGPRR
jgi:hypothetical protein